jgi:POT family proton-dependent oligopeptide transporter
MIQGVQTTWFSRLLDHPRGFYSLCVIELLGRFAFYMLVGALLMYAKDTLGGGLALSKVEASHIYGAYLALVFFTPVFGGVLATRWLGLRFAILAGGVLFAIGLVLMGVRDVAYFYLGLGLLCVANGLSRPSVSMLVGNLYPEKDQRRDPGFNILFFFVNLGALIGFLTAGAVRNLLNWQWVFWCAAIAIVISLIVFVANWTTLNPGEVRHPPDPKLRGALTQLNAKLLLPAAAFAAIGYFLSGRVSHWPLPRIETAVVFGMAPLIVFFVTLPWRVSAEERPRVHALLMVFLAATTFFAVLHMHGSALTIWADERTDRQVSWVPYIWTRDAELGYFANSPEQAPQTGEMPKIVVPELYQSWNPFWVIVLTPIVMAFFRKRELSGTGISTAKKMLYGLLLTAISMLIMELAAGMYELHQARVSGLWLVGMYCIITLGEICLSPMGQSIVTRLAPARLAGILMGGWFCAMAIGNELSGLLGAVQTSVPPWLFFLALTLAVGAVATLFWKFLPELDQKESVHS